MAKKDPKEKAPVFSEIIDSKINGYAIGISFLGISTFLLINNSYFHWTILTYFVGAVFGIIGVAGIGTELDKSKKIKGIGNLVIGLLCLGVWIAAFILLKNNPPIRCKSKKLRTLNHSGSYVGFSPFKTLIT